MPGAGMDTGGSRKRPREEDENDTWNDKENIDLAPSKRSSSRTGGGPRSCKSGHDLVMVPKEVRNLEKSEAWQCDGVDCRLDWSQDGCYYMDRPRYRCIHYRSGGGCDFDLCGECYEGVINPAVEVRKSGREPKPKYLGGRKDEWVLTPTYESSRRRRSSPTGKNSPSPRRIPSEQSSPRRRPDSSGEGRLSRDGDMLARNTRTSEMSSRSKSPKESPKDSGRTTRRSRGEDLETPTVADSGTRTLRQNSSNHRTPQQELETETEEEEERPRRSRNRRRRDHDSPPFYPSLQVRFSPSAKTGSPFGRKTRSAQRGLSSYIQTLNSEDEQTEFNKQYSRDLRRRQARKVSEDGEDEVAEATPEDASSLRRSSRRSIRGRRLVSESEDDRSLASRRSKRKAAKQSMEEDPTDDEDAEDPTVTKASVERRSLQRRKTRAQGAGDDADTESMVGKPEEVEDGGTEGTDETEEEEEEETNVRRSSRRVRSQVNRLAYEPRTPNSRNSREMRGPGVKNLDQYSSEDDFQVAEEGGSPRKRKYSLREKRSNTTRYQDEFPGNDDRKGTDKRLIRQSAIMPAAFKSRSGGRGGNGGRSRKDKNGGRGGNRSSRRHRTGDSSSPSSSSSCSDEEFFDRRKKKRMDLEREKLRPLNMNKDDVTKAIFKERSQVGASLADVQPMDMDMGVTFESVGGLKEHVNGLKEMVMFPLLYPELFSKFNIVPPRGVLFYGPPGTGKTLLARALASECSNEKRKVAFFMRKGADCLSKWIGESERQLRLLFDQAYQMRPSIIFFDEIDGLAPVRSSRQDQIHSSIVSTLLALMDGLDNRGEIIVIGATNRIENIDPALRRPGRFDRELRFSLPCRNTRKEILKLHTKDWDPALTPALLNTLAARTLGYCGADLKGLCAEAALNALKRRYPQIYESNKKLAIDIKQISVMREDFEKAMQKIVPSTHRVEDKLLAPLPKPIRPLLEPTFHGLVTTIKRIFPHSAAGKGAILPRTLTHRPRLLLVGGEGQGHTTYLGPALLHFMEKFPCQKLDIPALFSNSARTPEEAATQIIHSARRTMPGILYIPHLCMLWETISETVRASLTTLLADLPASAPLLILAVSDRPYSSLPPELQAMFLAYYREVFKIENPGENERREFFRPLFTSCTALPPKPKPPPVPVEHIPVAEEPECRKLTAREEKRLKKKEEALLRELRIFLRDIWAKINREPKFFMFRLPVNTDEVDDYLQYVKNPMDFEKMHMKLDDGEYRCAQDFLDDIDLIADNAIAYNSDLAYETNRIICHRSRALQDFAYALVKAEMDTDFEDECKDIVSRRKEATAKLKKIDKEQSKNPPVSPSKMQDLLSIASTACMVCRSKGDEDNMLLCDGCDAGYHTYCTQPRIEEVPEGDWFCVRCVEAGVSTALTGDNTPSNAKPGSGSGSGSANATKKRKRSRKSRWASGVAVSKKSTPVRRRLHEDEEKDDGEDKVAKDGDEDEEEHDEENNDEVPLTNGHMEVDEDSNHSDGKAAKADRKSVTPSTRSSERHQAAQIEEAADAACNGHDVSPASGSPAHNTSKEQRDTVKIDILKLQDLHEQLVSATNGYNVEKLERANTLLAKVVRKYRMEYDRTKLVADLQTEIDHIAGENRRQDRSQMSPTLQRARR